MGTVGFLGTRAGPLLDAALVFFIALPIVMYFVVRLARSGKWRRHRNAQAMLLALMLVAVLILEVDIRFGAASEAVQASAFAGSPILIGTFAVHLLIAIPTFAAWIALVVRSWRRFPNELPGAFSRKHVPWGRWIYAGVWLTSLTGTALYVMSFAW